MTHGRNGRPNLWTNFICWNEMIGNTCHSFDVMKTYRSQTNFDHSFLCAYLEGVCCPNFLCCPSVLSILVFLFIIWPNQKGQLNGASCLNWIQTTKRYIETEKWPNIASIKSIQQHTYNLKDKGKETRPTVHTQYTDIFSARTYYGAKWIRKK